MIMYISWVIYLHIGISLWSYSLQYINSLSAKHCYYSSAPMNTYDYYIFELLMKSEELSFKYQYAWCKDSDSKVENVPGQQLSSAL